MRVTVCELPHEPRALDEAWAALCEHTREHASQLVLLPEFAMLEPVWESRRFDAARWRVIEAYSDEQLGRLPELGAEFVVGTRPACVNGRRLNQAYLFSGTGGVMPLRSKYFLPEEHGSWEATWFAKGDPEFPMFHAGSAAFGVNICTELWALDTYAAYAELGVGLLLTPRATTLATASNWLSAGVVAAVRAGAFSLSSNRVDANGASAGISWIIDPNGQILEVTSTLNPFATVDIDLAEAARAKDRYPRYVFH
jgi:N-carbamoylputrescine amidase